MAFPAACRLADSTGTMETMLLHLHLVRHGQTFFNRYNRLQGWSNSPLTDAGLDANEAAGHVRPSLVSDMHFREQFYGYFEGQDMSVAWTAAAGPHGAKNYNDIVRKYGLAATRDFLKEADPFHDAESDNEYWHRVEDGFALIADNPRLKDGDHVLQISHGNTLLSLMHRFAPEGYDLSERPANGSVTCLDFDTNEPMDRAVSVVSYNQ